MALSEDLLSEHSEHLNDYKVACEQHPELKSFDSKLQERTTKAIGDLTNEAENKAVSPYAAYKVVSQHVVDVTESVTKFITEGDYNIRESEALKGLVDAYFESTKKTLDILDTIEKCVEEAEMGQLYIREAVIEFKNESTENNNVGGKKKYKKTLESLNKFKATGDPFSGQVLKNQFELVFEEQKSLMKAVKETKEIEALEKHLERLKKLNALADTIDEGIKLENVAMENVSTQIYKLERHIQTVLKLADTATTVEDNEAKTRLYLEEICGKVEKLTKEIKEVGGSVEDHINLISNARLRVMQKINSS